MESITYGDNPMAIKWHHTVFGGKADELTLEEAFEVADDTTIFVVPQNMLNAFQGMVFILGKRVGIFELKPETPVFEFNNSSSIDAVYPYPLRLVRRGDTAYRVKDYFIRPEKHEQREDFQKWRDRGVIL